MEIEISGLVEICGELTENNLISTFGSLLSGKIKQVECINNTSLDKTMKDLEGKSVVQKIGSHKEKVIYNNGYERFSRKIVHYNSYSVTDKGIEVINSAKEYLSLMLK